MPLCTFEELKDYLKEADSLDLLDYIKEIDGKYILNENKIKNVSWSSGRLQIAAMFMVLGEYNIAEKVHSLDWAELSGKGDKVANGILKKFMNSYP